MSHLRWLRLSLWIAIVPGLASCSKKEEPVPRTRNEIFLEGRALPAVYLTAKTHTRVIAPSGQMFVVDPGTGEVMWPALYCTNPKCPGQREGEPLLFIEPDKDYACPRCGTRTFVRPYVLPETAEKLKQLEAERLRRIAYERTIRLPPASSKQPLPQIGGPQPTRADPSTRP